ncbi:MAG: leucyl/phenylalanyl-tRNA--protein transferase [Anaerolineae bacterium]|nr:leucyl/phenylalanyl-tRNA--protein transferase [Anaerolineales bacterium]MCQ3973187.1 leucyl/phenylalanyl-tRNA--protein transferase [Anaerolineae bacterium]
MKLSPHLLLNAYSQGIFPMADEDGAIYWYDPDPRAIIPLDNFHVPRSLMRTIRRGQFEVRVDTAFRTVMKACAEPAPGRDITWINQEIITAYSELHALGFAHSVECWRAGELVGGLYGVSLGGLFAGESMFSRATDASKVALVYLVERLRRGGFVLLDTQFMTDHLRRFGAVEIPRIEYQARLVHALKRRARF